jgi:hypothetical protein
VAGIEEERGIAGIDRPVECQKRLGKRLPALVLRDHHVEAELFQRIAHGAGVVNGLLQFGDVFVVVVADHERDAFFGMGRACKRRQSRRETRDSQKVGKPTRHLIPRSPRSSAALIASCHSRHTHGAGSIPSREPGIQLFATARQK